MCKCPGGNGRVTALAVLTGVAVIFVALSIFLPWHIIRQEIMGSETVTGFSPLGYGQGRGRSEDWKGYETEFCDASDDLTSFCNKARTAAALLFIGLVVVLVSSITSCVQGCCKTPDSKCCGWVGVAFAVPAALLLFVGLTVFGSGKKELEARVDESQVLLGQMIDSSVMLFIGFYTSLVALMLVLVGLPLGLCGMKSLSTPQYQGSKQGAAPPPAVMGQVVEG